MIQDSDFVRWSSAFHHVFVFTVKKRCVLFIHFIVEKNFLCENIFSLLARNYKAQFGIAIKIYSVWILFYFK